VATRFIDELRISAGAEDELARHGIDPDEVLEVSWDEPGFYSDKVDGRDLMIGRTEGGRLLTIVIEQSPTIGAWDVVTGWESGAWERSRWRNSHRRAGRG
jgi:hypothetical protein